MSSLRERECALTLLALYSGFIFLNLPATRTRSSVPLFKGDHGRMPVSIAQNWRGNRVCGLVRNLEQAGRGFCWVGSRMFHEVWDPDFAGLGLGFLLRSWSRILCDCVAKKPDVVGLFGKRGLRGEARITSEHDCIPTA